MCPSTEGGEDPQPGSSCGLGQFGVIGDDLVGAESYCDGQVDGIVGSEGSECPRNDHVTASEVGEVHRVEHILDVADVDLVGCRPVAPCISV